ncbi:MAG: excinuclease ABC subunit A, partial [Chromatiales bacterium]
ICTGTPGDIAAHPHSHTGRALSAYGTGARPPRADAGAAVSPPAAIEIRHAREHNLQNVDIRIPRDRLTVITGVSGSGKSTVAFDILFAEGQRRYLESLNAYARQFVQPAARPDVDAVFGIPPTVAIEQRTSRGGHKSTVGTLTEIHHFLRLLFVKLGVQHCPECRIPIEPQSRDAIASRILGEHAGRDVELLAPLVVNRKGLYNELAKWADRKGFPFLRVDGELQPTDAWPRLDRFREHAIDLPLGEVHVGPGAEPEVRRLVDAALDHGKGALRLVVLPRGDGPRDERSFSTHRSCPVCGRSFDEPDPRLFSYNSRHGWCPTCLGTGLLVPGLDPEQSAEEGEWQGSDDEAIPCPECEGARLRPEALSVRFKEASIADYAALPVDRAADAFAALALDGREQAIGAGVLAEIGARLAFLQEVGLGYLSLDRGAPTLSGGEAQRIRLAAQLGSNLRGVCYILDEPTIGLHPRDNRMLLDTLSRLEGKGNTVVVVEHDEETIRRAGHLIDLGPGAGRLGGRLVAEGTLAQLMAAPESVTGRCLARPLRHPLLERRPVRAQWRLRLEGARLNNLQDLDVDIPLGRLVCVTGVSGSGKSTLVREVVVRTLRSLLAQRRRRGRPAAHHFHGCRHLYGWQAVDRVLEVDQTPIGKTPRSCPATYVGIWDSIRRLFAATPEARIHGWGPGRFSFNTRGGRCEVCQGQGVTKVEMSFLPDVRLVCEACGGSRFNAATLAVRYKGLSAGEVLALSVDEAREVLEAHPAVLHALNLLSEVGLGYLTLGQHSPTLSGGEAQRIKLVTELAKARPGIGRAPSPTLYVLDEPTVGLHMADVEKLIRVLHRLVDAGHSVIVIEHNLDVIAEADWIIDLGPEGGDNGGRVTARGTPNQLAQAWRKSRTAEALRAFLRTSAAGAG